MMMIEVMINNKYKLRSDGKVADWLQLCGVALYDDYDVHDDGDDDETAI